MNGSLSKFLFFPVSASGRRTVNGWLRRHGFFQLRYGYVVVCGCCFLGEAIGKRQGTGFWFFSGGDDSYDADDGKRRRHYDAGLKRTSWRLHVAS
jgi:hypothetical protein